MKSSSETLQTLQMIWEMEKVILCLFMYEIIHIIGRFGSVLLELFIEQKTFGVWRIEKL